MAMCLYAVLALFWGSVNEAQAERYAPYYPVSVSITPQNDLTNVWIVLENYTNNSNAFTPISIYGFYGMFGTGVIPAHTTTNFSFAAQLASDLGGSPPFAYTIFGVYDDATNGVTVGSNSITATTPWGTIFTDVTEATVASWLGAQGGTGSFISQFSAQYASILFTNMGTDLQLWNFSGATDGGKAHASNVPLPPAFLLLGPGLVGLAAVRRRFGK
jgi:hypothetical protein